MSSPTSLPDGVPHGAHNLKLPAPKTNPFDPSLEYTFVAHKPETYYAVKDGLLDQSASIIAGDSWSYTLQQNPDGTYPSLEVFVK